MALIMITKVIAPNIWGWVADHTGRRTLIIKLTTFVTAIAFAGVFMGQGYWWMAAVMCVFSFFWNAALPQFEATTMSSLGEQVHKYSSIRLWGSVGFILAVVVLGELLEYVDIGVVPMVIWGLLIGLFFVTLLAPGDGKSESDLHGASIWSVLKRREVLVLLAVCFLLQASHGPYYTFFTIYLEEYEYSRGTIGRLWALGVVAEIGVFLIMHRLMPRFGPYVLLLWSLGLTTVRWLLIAAYPDSLAIILFAQGLHAASFGIYHAVAIHLIHKFFVGRHQGRGQALYSSLSFGAGGAVGSLFSGYMWETVSPAATYYSAAAMSALAVLIACWGIKEKDMEKNL